MADWGILSPFFEFGRYVGGAVSGAGAQAGAAISPYIPTPQPAPAPAPVQTFTGGGGGGSNPVSSATSYYNQNYSVTTPGYTQIAPTPIQSVAATPATRFDAVGGISAAFGGIAAFGGQIGQQVYLAGAQYGRDYSQAVNRQPAPAFVSMPTPVSNMIDAPRGIIPQPGQQGIAQRGDIGQTFFVSGGKVGDKGQIAIEQGKLVYGETGGAFGIMQSPKSIYESEGFTRRYGWVTSSGGPGALQSGQFSTQPLTPNVYTQESGGKVLSKYAVPEYAAMVEQKPSAYSRLGAEAYGGYVLPLDNRTLQPGTQMSRYATEGNLANLVNPVGTNLPKQNWETIPWAITHQGAPNIQRVDLEGRLTGITPAPDTGFNIGAIKAGVSGEYKGMQITPAPMGVYDAGVAGMPVPFRAKGEPLATTIIEPPTGALPIVGVVPVVSPILAFFEPGKSITTQSSITNLPEVTKLTGTKTEIYPTGTLTTDYYETTGGKVATTTTMEKPTPSVYETFVNQGIRDLLKLPSAAEGEVALRAASLSNIFIAPSIISTEILKGISPELGKAARTVESLNPFSMEGQYKQFYEQPLLVPASYAAGAIFGSVFKGVEAGVGAGRAAAAESIISKGGTWRAAEIFTGGVMEYAPKVLGGLYGLSIAQRSTEGFTNLAPEQAIPKARGLVIQEAVPMGAGFALPEQTIRAARLSDIGYKSALQEGATTGRFDYYIGEPAARSIRAAEIDYKGFIQERAPQLTAQQKIAQDVLSIQGKGGAFQPGSFENAYVYSVQTGERLAGPIKGTSTSAIANQDINLILDQLVQTRPLPEEFALYHTHPGEPFIPELTKAIGWVKSGEITPTTFITKTPRIIYDYFTDVSTTPSTLDILSMRESSTYSGVTQEGVISGNKLATYKTQVGGENTPSGIYKAFAKAINLGGGEYEYNPTGQTEAEFLRTGKGLGFEPAIQTRAELAASIPKEPGVLDYLSYKIQKPLMEAEFKVSLFFEKMGRPDLTISPQEITPTQPTGSLTQIPSSRIGTKIVGGKKVGGLRPEPSLKSMGVLEGTTTGTAPKQYGEKIGTPSETMKPWDLNKAGGKQSAISLSIMSEQLPGMEPATAPAQTPTQLGFGFAPMQVPQARAQAERFFTPQTTGQHEAAFLMQQPSFIIPQQQKQQQGIVQVVRPEFATTEKQQYGVVFAQAFEQGARQREAVATIMAMDVMQGQRTRQVQEQAMAFSTDQLFKRSQESVRRQGFVTDQSRIPGQRYEITTTPRFTQTPYQETTTRQRTDQIITPTYKQSFKETPPPPIPLPKWFPDFPGSSGAGGGRKRRASFIERFNMGLDLSIGRPKKARAKSYTSPKHPRMYKPKRKKK